MAAAVVVEVVIVVGVVVVVVEEEEGVVVVGRRGGGGWVGGGGWLVFWWGVVLCGGKWERGERVVAARLVVWEVGGSGGNRTPSKTHECRRTLSPGPTACSGLTAVRRRMPP